MYKLYRLFHNCIDCFTNVLYADKIKFSRLKSRDFISIRNWSEMKSREYVCHLQHVEAEGLVLRAQHTQLRPALHWPGNSNERVYTTHTRPQRRACIAWMARANACLRTVSRDPIRPLAKVSARARDTYVTCVR